MSRSRVTPWQRLLAGVCLGVVMNSVWAWRPAVMRSEDLTVWAQGRETVALDTWRELGENRNPRSDHPWTVDAELLSVLLASAQCQTGSGPRPLFSSAQIARLARPWAQAFGKADTKLDVVVTTPNECSGKGWLHLRSFYTKGALNLIAGGVEAEVAAGTRGRAASEAPRLLATRGGEAPRPDWLVLNSQEIAFVRVPATAMAAAPVAVAPVETLPPAAPVAAVSVPVVAAVTSQAIAPATAPAAAPPVRAAPVAAANCLGDIKARLNAVDQLHREGAISTDEQRRARRRILDEL